MTLGGLLDFIFRTSPVKHGYKCRVCSHTDHQHKLSIRTGAYTCRRRRCGCSGFVPPYIPQEERM